MRYRLLLPIVLSTMFLLVAASYSDESVQLIKYRGKQHRHRTLGIASPSTWGKIRLDTLFSGIRLDEKRTKVDDAVISTFDHSPECKQHFQSVQACTSLVIGDLARRQILLPEGDTADLLLPENGSISIAQSKGPDFFLFLTVNVLYDDIDSLQTDISWGAWNPTINGAPVTAPNIGQKRKQDKDIEYCVHAVCSFGLWDRQANQLALAGKITADGCLPRESNPNRTQAFSSCMQDICKQVMEEMPFR